MGSESEQVISDLNTKNLGLEEQNRTLKLDICELEQLHQIDEEIIEAQKETERELLLKINEQMTDIAAMKQQVSECENRAQDYENTILNFQQRIADLNEQLEGQMNSEQIIAELTAKNLDLEEQNRTLKLDICELEQLHQMDDEILEAQKETEKELLLKIDEQMTDTSAMKRQIADWENRAQDYEKAILKFRQRTADLNEEVQNLKDELATMQQREEEKARAAGAEISLLANVNRAFSEVVETEQKAVDLVSAKHHIGYLRSFLPDNFTKPGGDNDSLLLCLLFPRLSAKSLLLARLLQQKFPPVPGGLRPEHVTLSHRAEQWAHVRLFGYQLHLLHTVLLKFTSVFKNCSVERLSRLSVQQMDISCQEKHLDQYFDLLRQNRFDENTSVDRLERIVHFFQRLFSANLSAETYNARDELQNTLVQIKEGLGWIQFNAQRLRYFVMDAAPSSASVTDSLSASVHSSLMAKSMTGSHVSAPGSSASADLEFFGFVDQLVQLLTECEGMAIRALNRIPAENELIMTPELNERILSAIASLEKCGHIVRQCCSLAVSQLGAIDSEGLPAQQMLEFVLSSVEKYVGQMDGNSRAHAQIFDSLDSIKSTLDALSEALDNSSMEIPPKNKHGFPPLLERAHARKNDAVEAEGLRWQVAKRDEELLKLQRALKAKESDLSTLKLRLELMEKEKQMAENAGGGVNAEMQRLQMRCEQLQEELNRQKEDYESNLEQLEGRLADSEREREKERERTREFSKKALFANIQQQQQSAAMAAVQQSTATTPLSQLGSSISSLSATTMVGNSTSDSGLTPNGHGQPGLWEPQNANALNELRIAREKIQILESQHLPSLDQQHALPCEVCMERNRNEHEELQEMLDESDALVRQSNHLLRPTHPKEVDRYKRTVDSINFRAESLRIRFHRFWRKYRHDQPIPRLLLPVIECT